MSVHMVELAVLTEAQYDHGFMVTSPLRWREFHVRRVQTTQYTCAKDHEHTRRGGEKTRVWTNSRVRVDIPAHPGMQKSSSQKITHDYKHALQ